MLKLCNFEEQYSLEVSGSTALANVVDPEAIYILEGSSDDEFRVRCLSPTLPTNRFYHLLHRQRFDEAMQLAITFGLDIEMVHRVRVTSLLDAATSCRASAIVFGRSNCDKM